MNSKAYGMVYGSFAGDALALGVHWIYNCHVIDRKVGRVENYLDPVIKSYHPNRKAGEFTHYGDQTMVLLESLAAKNGFDLEDFAERWRAFFADYDGYMDEATKATLENFDEGAAPEASGAPSTELAGAARIAPLVFWYRSDPEQLATAARAQTAMTHNSTVVVECSAFFALAAAAVLGGESPTAAIERVLRANPNFESLFGERVELGLATKGKDTRTTIADLGQACYVDAAFPSVIHLVSTYETDFKEGLVANVMAGGDSAARGLVTGLLLGAYNGMEAIPRPWLTELKASERISALLAQTE